MPLNGFRNLDWSDLNLMYADKFSVLCICILNILYLYICICIFVFIYLYIEM